MRQRLGQFGRRVLALGAAAVALTGLALGYRYWAGRSPVVATLAASEEWILRLTPELKRLARDLENLSFPGPQGRGLFADRVELVDLTPQAAATADELPSPTWLSAAHWPISADTQTISRSELALWGPLLAELDFFRRAKVYFVRAAWAHSRATQAEAELGFDGAARLRDGREVWIKAHWSSHWQQLPHGDDDRTQGWRITRLVLRELKTLTAARTPFRELLARAVPDKRSRDAATQAAIDEMVVRLIRDENYNPLGPHYLATFRWNPGGSVVDFDRDGWDDWYLVKPWGRAQLFHNRGDGTFVDVAPELGLDVEHFGASTLFADWDNDGDDDLILGRTMRPSLYFRNEGGRFIDRTRELAPAGLPTLASALAAADYNGDGWLDLYVSTYAHQSTHEALQRPRWLGGDESLLDEFLPPETAAEMGRRSVGRHKVLDSIGPPNHLWLGVGGGRLAPSPLSGDVAVWRNSYQATWCDYDDDGDPDLYVANDFAPNNLFRNEGGEAFTDVTAESGTADLGFGMGASWGDYDGDGRFDLYVSNMYSKAGRRITAQVPGLDERFALMARGNSLFRNLDGAKFDKVSGLEAPALAVENAGWAWSGQFVDLDNDTFLDVHSPNGNVTVPDEVAFDVDL